MVEEVAQQLATGRGRMEMDVGSVLDVGGLLKKKQSGKITDYLIKDIDFKGMMGARSFLQEEVRKMGGTWQQKTFGSKSKTTRGILGKTQKKSSMVLKKKGAKLKTGKGRLTGIGRPDSSQLGLIDYLELQLRRKSRLGPVNSHGSSENPDKT